MPQVETPLQGLNAKATPETMGKPVKRTSSLQQKLFFIASPDKHYNEGFQIHKKGGACHHDTEDKVRAQKEILQTLLQLICRIDLNRLHSSNSEEPDFLHPLNSTNMQILLQSE